MRMERATMITTRTMTVFVAAETVSCRSPGDLPHYTSPRTEVHAYTGPNKNPAQRSTATAGPVGVKRHTKFRSFT